MKERYYYSIEQQKIVSLSKIRQEFEEFQKEGQYIDESFDYYLKGCMYWENGDLIPIIDYYDRLRKTLAKAEQLAWKYGKSSTGGIIIDTPSDEYDDEIETLRAQIAEVEKYL